MGYKFQFVTLAGFHALNHGMFELARAYRDEGMTAYSRLQQAEFASEAHGYTATRHQREVGTGYFDDVANVIAAGQASTTALDGLDGERAVLGVSRAGGGPLDDRRGAALGPPAPRVPAGWHPGALVFRRAEPQGTARHSGSAA